MILNEPALITEFTPVTAEFWTLAFWNPPPFCWMFVLLTAPALMVELTVVLAFAFTNAH